MESGKQNKEELSCKYSDKRENSVKRGCGWRIYASAAAFDCEKGCEPLCSYFIRLIGMGEGDRHGIMLLHDGNVAIS